MITGAYARRAGSRRQGAAADGEAFLADNAKRAEVKVTDSGLQYEVLVEGTVPFR